MRPADLPVGYEFGQVSSATQRMWRVLKAGLLLSEEWPTTLLVFTMAQRVEDALPRHPRPPL